MIPWRPIVRRAGWNFTDQALSSLTNFALTLLIARSLAPREFGVFTIVYSVAFLFVQLSRALASEPLVVRHSNSLPQAWRRATKQSTGAAVSIGLIGGFGCLVAAPFFHGLTRSVVLALGVVLPGLLLQDTWRFAFFAQARPWRAAANDLIWALVQFGALAWLLRGPNPSAASFVLAWGGGATFAAILGAGQAKLMPNPLLAVSWLREQSSLAPRFAAEFLVTRGAAQLTFCIVGVIGGLAAVASLRASQILLSPLNILFLGVVGVAVPEGVRLLPGSKAFFLRGVRVLSALLAALSLAWGVVLLLLPPNAGRHLLGGNWDGAHSLLPPMIVLFMAWAVSLGPSVGLRALAEASTSLRTRLVSAPLHVAAGTIGVALGGAFGAATGLAISSCIAASISWRSFSALSYSHPRVSGRAQSALAPP